MKTSLLSLLSIGISYCALAQQPGLEDMSYLKNKQNNTSSPPVDLELEKSGQVPYVSLTRALENKEIVTKLNLSNQNLSEFPVELLMLSKLEHLDLSGNNIAEVPPSIAQLTNLKVLALSKNQLSTLPSTIGNLAHLEVLLIEHNRKQFVLPTSIANLGRLKKIWCSDLVELPAFFWNMKSVEDARLWSVNLQEVPVEIKNMVNLNEICFRDNSLTSLPAEIFSLPNLTYLNLGNNKFTAIPTGINKLSKLDYLGVYGNPISGLDLDDKMFSHLRFLAVWETNLPSTFAQEVELKSATTKVNQTGKDLH